MKLFFASPKLFSRDRYFPLLDMAHNQKLVFMYTKDLFGTKFAKVR